MECSPYSQGKGKKNKRRAPLSIVKDIFTDCRIQCEPFFLFSILKMLLHCLLASIIASEKSVVMHILVPLHLMYLFPLAALEIFLPLFDFKLLNHDVYRCDMLCIYFAWRFLIILGL